MDLQDQLKNLFPDPTPRKTEEKAVDSDAIWMQDDPIICKYEKRKGKPITILEGYTGADADFKKLAKEIKMPEGVELAESPPIQRSGRCTRLPTSMRSHSTPALGLGTA